MQNLINIYKLWNKKEKKWIKKGVSGFLIAKSFKIMDVKKLQMVLSSPSNITAYFMAGLELYKRSNVDTLTRTKHATLFMVIDELAHGMTPTQSQYDAILCRTKKGLVVAKSRAYEFLQESEITDISEHTYFTRGKWCDAILKDVEGSETLLAEILTNYEKYLENTEWRKVLKEKEEEEDKLYKRIFIEEKVVKRTFLEWLHLK
jgi:hypothetical protein